MKLLFFLYSSLHSNAVSLDREFQASAVLGWYFIKNCVWACIVCKEP